MMLCETVWSYGAGRRWTGTVAFGGLYDVTLSLSLNPCPCQRGLHSWAHTHSQWCRSKTGRSLLPSLTHSEKGRGEKYEGCKGRQEDLQGRVRGIERGKGEKGKMSTRESGRIRGERDRGREREVDGAEGGREMVIDREGKMSRGRLGLEAHWWKDIWERRRRRMERP